MNISLRKIGVIHKLQPLLLKQKLQNDEIFEDTWEAKENEWLPFVKMTCYQLFSVMLDI